jgi:hypothetical protein
VKCDRMCHSVALGRGETRSVCAVSGKGHDKSGTMEGTAEEEWGGIRFWKREDSNAGRRCVRVHSHRFGRDGLVISGAGAKYFKAFRAANVRLAGLFR